MIMTEAHFKKTIWKFYLENKRSFPWRTTRDPYKIMVSEIMLQQTQTDRVVKKYEEWMTHFPTIESLAMSSLQKVLTHWQGLGYNRRALALKRTAETIFRTYDGNFPQTYDDLLELPGIGPYTAGAVMAFAYNKPFPVIETNIRTVFIHFFFKDEHGMIHDKEILPLIEKTLDTVNPREWYYALMDYGVMLKKTIGNLNKKSRHYTKQSSFKGSNREIRSAIVRAITKKASSEKDLVNMCAEEQISVTKAQLGLNIAALLKEGFIVKKGQKFAIL